MRGRDRNAQERDHHDRNRAARLGAESADGLELCDLRSHGFDDPPPPGERAQRDRCMRGENYPDRDMSRLAEKLSGNERGEDYSHRLLRVIEAMRQTINRG